MRRAAAMLASALALAGCSGVQSPLAPAGEQAASLGLLFWLTLGVAAVMYTLVLGFLGASAWRARRLRAESAPVVSPNDGRLTTGMLAWCALIVGGLTLLITASFLAERSLAAARSHERLEVRVTAHQWWWRIAYRDSATGGWVETANELHLPVGQTARIALGSADVIHSFWVPNVAGKMDVIPGRANALDVTPVRTGWFRGQCAEFCGVQHAHMAFDVKVESAAEFAAWLAMQAKPATPTTDPVLARGAAVVAGGPCSACHVVRGTAAGGRAGPDLTHIGSRRSIAAGTMPMSRGALQGWIAQPQALKPGTMMPPVPLAPADADAVSRYLESLR